MEAISERTVKITLKMNEKEARWLRAHVQNPSLNEGEYEGQESRAMREKFFNTIKGELEN